MAESAPRPPSSPKVFGVIHLVLAGILALGLLAGLLMPLLMDQPNPLDRAIGVAGRWVFTGVTSAAQLALTLLLARAGQLLLQRRDAGRRLTNWLAVLSMAWFTAMLVPQIAWVVPHSVDIAMEQQRQQQQARGGQPSPAFFETFMRVAMYAGVVISTLLSGFVYQITCLVMLNKPAIKAHLQQQA